jgi:hypothetical protein
MTWIIGVNLRFAYVHKYSLPTVVMDAMKSVFRELAREDLKRCHYGKTQNPNESLNSVIWTTLLKIVFIRLDTLKFQVHDAVLCFNDHGSVLRGTCYF